METTDTPASTPSRSMRTRNKAKAQRKDGPEHDRAILGDVCARKRTRELAQEYLEMVRAWTDAFVPTELPAKPQLICAFIASEHLANADVLGRSVIKRWADDKVNDKIVFWQDVATMERLLAEAAAATTTFTYTKLPRWKPRCKCCKSHDMACFQTARTSPSRRTDEDKPCQACLARGAGCERGKKVIGAFPGAQGDTRGDVATIPDDDDERAADTESDDVPKIQDAAPSSSKNVDFDREATAPVVEAPPHRMSVVVPQRSREYLPSPPPSSQRQPALVDKAAFSRNATQPVRVGPPTGVRKVHAQASTPILARVENSLAADSPASARGSVADDDDELPVLRSPKRRRGSESSQIDQEHKKQRTGANIPSSSTAKPRTVISPPRTPVAASGYNTPSSSRAPLSEATQARPDGPSAAPARQSDLDTFITVYDAAMELSAYIQRQGCDALEFTAAVTDMVQAIQDSAPAGADAGMQTLRVELAALDEETFSEQKEMLQFAVERVVAKVDGVRDVKLKFLVGALRRRAKKFDAGSSS